MIAIDLGSNTFRIVQLDCETGSFLYSFERVVKTADGLEDTGKVNREAVERVIRAIHEARQEIDFSSDSLRAVTTEAIRRADNAAEVLDTIYRETGVKFETISGEEEARLTLLAVRHRMKLLNSGEKSGKKSDTFLLVDIGGGSTELIFHYPHKVLMRSFPIGIVTIVQRYHTFEEIEESLSGEMGQIEQYIRDSYRSEGRVDTFVATAGTPTTVAALKRGMTYASYDPEAVNGTKLSVQDLMDALERLLSMSPADREKHVGVGRGDLITAGILIFRELFLMSDMGECVVIDDSLREGVALQGCHPDI